MFIVLIEKLKNKKGKKWIIIYLACVINFGVFLLFLWILRPYWGEINTTVSDWWGFNFNLILFLYFLFTIPLLYSLIFLIFSFKKLLKGNELILSRMYKLIPFVLMLIFNILISFLLDELGSYSRLIPQYFEFYSIFIFLTIQIILILLVYPLLKNIPHLKANLSNKIIRAKGKSIIIITCILIGYGFAFATPFFYIPANVHEGDLPPKPDLIAHRGGASLGPENTLIAAEVALQFGIVGWEVDIQISKDGVPFLMHDDTLTRTTNIRDVFPDRVSEPAENFTISELKQLDAGSWFVDKDPFGVIAAGIISPEQAESYRGVKIPTLAEVLKFTKNHDIYLDFDMKSPSNDHPYHDEYFEIILDTTLRSGINLSKIMIPTKNEKIMNMLMYKDAMDVLTGYEYINTGDAYTNEEYRIFYQQDFPVMVYTIDSVERFCELWCLGVTWVKTNAPHEFYELETPIISIRLESYKLIWIISTMAVFIITLGIILKELKATK